jgi:hypothetical protein
MTWFRKLTSCEKVRSNTKPNFNALGLENIESDAKSIMNKIFVFLISYAIENSQFTFAITGVFLRTWLCDLFTPLKLPVQQNP